MSSLRSLTTTYLLKRLVKAPSAQKSSPSSVRMAVNAFTRLAPRQSQVRILPNYESLVRGEWLFPEGASEDSVIYFIHGGGYFFGSPITHRPLTTELSQKAKTPIFALKYRLAPEHSFPAPINDAVAGYEELLNIGFTPDRIVMAGDSAGGGLTLATLVALRDRGYSLPAGAVLFCPWTDLAITGDSIKSNAHSCAMFREPGLHQAAQQYLGGTSPFHPLASPLYADLNGLPPLTIHVSNSETLYDDSIRLLDKARSCGVASELEVYSNQPHVWQIFSYLPEAASSVSEAAAKIGSWIPPRVA